METPRAIDWAQIMEEEKGQAPPDKLQWQEPLQSAVPVDIPKWSTTKNTFRVQKGYIVRYSRDGRHALVMKDSVVATFPMRVGLLEKLNGPLNAPVAPPERVKARVFSLASGAFSLCQGLLNRARGRK